MCREIGGSDTFASWILGGLCVRMVAMESTHRVSQGDKAVPEIG